MRSLSICDQIDAQSHFYRDTNNVRVFAKNNKKNILNQIDKSKQPTVKVADTQER